MRSKHCDLPTAGNGTNFWTRIFIAGLRLFALLIKTLRPSCCIGYKTMILML